MARRYLKCVCIIAGVNDFLRQFVRIVSNEGLPVSWYRLKMVLGRPTINILFEQLIDIFILLIKEMKLCCKIGDGIETDSHGSTEKRYSLRYKVSVFLFVKLIYLFNSLNHWKFQ